MVMVFD